MRAQARSNLGCGCAILFGLPFAAVGGFMLWTMGATLLNFVRMQAWTPVEMTILAAEVQEHRGDDSTTYIVVARYQYQIDGQQFENDRVSLHGDSQDNFGDFHQRLGGQLKQRVQTGQPWTGFVNPDDPGDAVLTREFRWSLFHFESMFALVFGGVGFGIIAGILAFGREPGNQELVEQHPTEPWLWKRPWRDARVPYDGRPAATVAAAVAFWWNLVTLPCVLLVPVAWNNGNRWSALAALYVVAGGLLVRWAWRRRRGLREFGTAELELIDPPYWLGETLRATIRLEHPVAHASYATLYLVCLDRSGEGGQQPRLKLTDEIHQLMMLSAIPVEFELPVNQPPSAPRRNTVVWQVRLVLVNDSGLRFKPTFDVPVFARPERESARGAS